jgi:hypothetical protein
MSSLAADVTRLSQTDLLFHPVRMRIVQAFLNDRTLTVGELATEMPEVPTATLYRHVGLLTDGGVLEIVDERPVRGTVERSYRLKPTAVHVDRAEADAMTPEQRRQAFMTILAGLLAEFDRVPEYSLPAHCGYDQCALNLTEGEAVDFALALRRFLQPWQAKRPTASSGRYQHTFVILPTP